MNKLHIYKDTKIFVACPANAATGGPELLHQLVHELSKLGFNAYMFYYNRVDNLNPINDIYKDYGNKFVDDIEDSSNNIFITPEVKTTLIYDYENIQKVIWWLSIDNYYKQFKSNNFFKKIVKQVLYKVGYFRVFNFEKDDYIFHFVQSEYARQYLLKKGIGNIFFLSDYLNNIFIKKQLMRINNNKDDIVIYNPKKGVKFTKKLIEKLKNIKFIPIENMTREEVSELLSKAKVYIDFGNHPGKDRIPREAAISGCCVITGKDGSAKYYKDIAVLDEFKFDAIDKNLNKIVEKINSCFVNYEIEFEKFNPYRDVIINEQSKFIKETINIFGIFK